MAVAGLKWFRVDVELDDKFELVCAEFGSKAFEVIVRLWQKIYSSGYYCEWNEEVALLFAKKYSLGGGAVSEIIKCAVKRELFDKYLFDRFGILTSHGIQEWYFDSIERRKSVEVVKEYLLVDLSQKLKNVEIIYKNVNRNAENADISQYIHNTHNIHTQHVYNAREEKPLIELKKEKNKDEDSRFNAFLDMVKEVCPIIWKRSSVKIQFCYGEDTKVKSLLKALGKSDEELRKFFEHISKTYIIKPSFENLDLYWSLNNWKKVENTVEDQKASQGVKQNFSQREYSKEQLNSLFASEDEE